MSAPTHAIKGKEFEGLVLDRASHMEDAGQLTMGRYGVQAVMMRKPGSARAEWMVIPSLPDFEGIIAVSGRQIIIEAKVCSQASYPIVARDDKSPKQIEHMLKRAHHGALCFLLLHFNPRSLLRKDDPAATFAIKVHPDDHFWRMYNAYEIKSLDRETAALYGTPVPWTTWSSRTRKLTPDISILIPELSNQFQLTN